MLTTNGLDAKLYKSIKKLAKVEGATLEIIAPKIGVIESSEGEEISPHHFLAGAPSPLFDCVIVAPAESEVSSLLNEAAAIDWIRSAFAHLKVIGFQESSKALFDKASVKTDADEGMVNLSKDKPDNFVTQAKKHRIWDRELAIRSC